MTITPLSLLPSAGISHPARRVPSDEKKLAFSNGILYAAGVTASRSLFGRTVIQAISAPDPIQKPKISREYAANRLLAVLQRVLGLGLSAGSIPYVIKTVSLSS